MEENIFRKCLLLFSSKLIFTKILNNKIYKIVIFPNLYMVVREKYKLKAFKTSADKNILT